MKFLNTDDCLKNDASFLLNIFSSTRNDGHPLAITEFALSEGEQMAYYSFRSPDTLHEVRSISKFVVALCIGILLESLGLNHTTYLDTNIWPFIRSKVKITANQNSMEILKEATIAHLLTQTIGYKNSDILFSSTLQEYSPNDYFDILMMEQIIFQNGEKFRYSNATAYLLSVIFQESVGINLYQYAKNHLFEPLNITPHEWINYGAYCAGATGLKLRCKDLQKLGQLVLKNGLWNGTRIISSTYLDAMTTPKVVIEDDNFLSTPLAPVGYGYFTWIDSAGNYYASGANGQYMVVLPSKKQVLTIFAQQPNTMYLQQAIKTYILYKHI